MSEDKKQTDKEQADKETQSNDALTTDAESNPAKTVNEPADDTLEISNETGEHKERDVEALEEKNEEQALQTEPPSEADLGTPKDEAYTGKTEDEALLATPKSETLLETPENEPEKSKKTDIIEDKSTSVNNKKNTGKRFLIVLFVFIILFILGGAGFSSYKIYDYFNQQNAELAEQFKALKNEYSNVTSRIDSAQKKNETHAATHQAFVKQLDTFNKKIQTAEQRLASQRKRILSMSTTSREDWLLAEAEYLIKLANQRILVERNAQGAAALLVEADSILKDLGDPDLFSIRRQLANDISSVRLIDKVDVEGVFLQMQALIHAVESLPINPTWNQKKTTASLIINNEQPQDAETEQAQENNDAGILGKTKKRFYSFLQTFDNYVRIRKYDDQEEKTLLIATPEQSQYYKQILQLMIEKASVALLREQPIIFAESLNQAQTWLDKKFPVSSKQSTLIAELEKIKKIDIEQELPDITQSLEALREYILTLHSLKGTASQGGEK